MSVRWRLMAGFLAVASLVGLMSVVTFRQISVAVREAAVSDATNVAWTVAADIAFDPPDSAGDGVSVMLFDRPLALAAYVARLHDLHQRDISVTDVKQLVHSDAKLADVGTVFAGDPGDEVGATIRDGRPRTFMAASRDGSAPARLVVVPLAAQSGQALGAVVLEYTPMYDAMMAQSAPILRAVGLLGLLCVLVTMLLGVLLSVSLTRRLRTLIAAVGAVADGHYARRVRARPGRYEFDRLGVAFNQMAEQLELTARDILAKEYTDSILANAGEGICGMDAEGRISFANAAAGQMTALGVAGLLGQDAATVLCVAREHLGASFAGGAGTRTFKGEIIRPDTSAVRVEYTLTAINKGGHLLGAVILMRDVSRQHELELDLRHQALHDALTGLANRTLFQDRLSHAIKRAAITGEKLSVLFLDLDDFKHVNDSLGHLAGDALLSVVADRLLSAVRVGDTVARFGGDEFAVLLEPGDAATTGALARRLLDELNRRIPVGGRDVVVGASIGAVNDIATYRDPGDVMRDADVAMHAAKRHGKGSYRVFEADMHTQAVVRLDVESRLRGAAGRGELLLYLQPIVELRTMRIHGVEALVRWQDPERGLQFPDSFIPLAEKTGLIVEIDQWMLEQACRTLRQWQDLGPHWAPATVSVNLSAAQLETSDLAERVAGVLSRTGLAAGALILELTETALMRDVGHAAEGMQRLRDIGVRLAIDDFGTGYSSLSYLRDIPVDILKIDRAFVAGMDQEDRAHRARDLVGGIIQLSHTLGLRVTAEGVEHEQQVLDLAAMGCDFAQGYHLGRPAPAAQIEQTLRQHDQLPVR